MKLHATIRSLKGKTVSKSANDLITITLYGEDREAIGDILFSSCGHETPCHNPRYLVQVRVFGKKLKIEVVDYPDKELPPYLIKG